MGLTGNLGQRDPMISILKTGMRKDPKDRKKQIVDFAAIERFKQDDGSHIYIQTPFPEKLIRNEEKLKAYLEDNRRKKGSFKPTADEWNQGTKTTKGDQTASAARATAIPDYTDEISGNLDHKSERRIARIIRMATASDREFLKTLMG